MKVNMILPGSQLDNSGFTSRGHFCSRFQNKLKLLCVFKTGMNRKSAFIFQNIFLK